ncbi:MAG: hypothetical protein U9O87_04500, partial [Verrucomicrobiota bacterium]|nr:hypothetical protein [Verrucomicrobiota bacterium]
SYSTILVTNMKTIRSSTLKLLEKFIEQGGNVVFCGNPPELVNAIPSHKAEILAKKTVAIPEKGDYLLNYLNDKVRRLSICDEQNNELKNVLYQLREDEQGYYLFICNTGYNEKQLIIPEKNDPTLVRERNEKHPDVHIKWHEKMLPEVLELDLSSGTFSAIKMQKRGGIAEIKTELSPIEGRMFFLSKKSLNFEYPEKIRLKEIAKSEINMQNCNIQLSEPNVLVLDYPAYKIADSETWNDPNEILRIDMYVRDSLNLNRRGGQMLQPWAKKKKNDPKSIMVDLEYSFNADYIPENDVFIALECPETFSITLNGTPIDTDNIVGWWVDKSLQKIKIPADSIKNGENILQLSCNYSEEHSGLEIIYLLGDFGVELSEGRVLLNNPIETLKIGDWVPQGLPFYSGAVSYNTKINLSQDRDKKYFLYIPEYRGTAIEVNVNGKSAGSILWRPNEVEITELLKNGENLLKIEVVSHRRNSHGPLHHNEKWPEWTGPWQFTTENDEWQNEYQLVPCGLMKTPEIIIKKGI